MTSSFFIFCFIIVLSALLGGFFPLFKRWKEETLKCFISFGAGVLLGAAFFHMMPESFEKIGAKASFFVFAGFFVLFISEKFIIVHACDAQECSSHHTLGISSFFGLSLHSITDGVALGSGAGDGALAFAIFLAIVAHKPPCALALSSVLIRENFSKKAVIFSTVLFSLMVPLGALVTAYSSKEFFNTSLGYPLAFSTGTFLQIAISDLLPEIHKESGKKTAFLLSFIAGTLIMAGTKYFV